MTKQRCFHLLPVQTITYEPGGIAALLTRPQSLKSRRRPTLTLGHAEDVFLPELDFQRGRLTKKWLDLLHEDTRCPHADQRVKVIV